MVLALFRRYDLWGRDVESQNANLQWARKDWVAAGKWSKLQCKEQVPRFFSLGLVKIGLVYQTSCNQDIPEYCNYTGEREREPRQTISRTEVPLKCKTTVPRLAILPKSTLPPVACHLGSKCQLRLSISGIVRQTVEFTCVCICSSAYPPENLPRQKTD